MQVSTYHEFLLSDKKHKFKCFSCFEREVGSLRLLRSPFGEFSVTSDYFAAAFPGFEVERNNRVLSVVTSKIYSKSETGIHPQITSITLVCMK
jgi:hypothetical protein